MDRVIYDGKDYLIDLPARDMTIEEWKSYPKKLTDAALELGLYHIEKSEVIDA